MAAQPRTYTGVIHIHTVRSDGGGTLEEVVRAAKENGIDFVLLTDHGTRGYGGEGEEGWHDGVLVLCGEEVSTPEGHLLAFETREDVGPRETLSGALEEIRRQCGIAATAHHQIVGGPFPAPPMEMADLVEIWSFMDEFLSRVDARSILQATTRPEKVVSGPARRLLWQWDRELQKRRLPIIGGLNVHQKKHPLLEWKMLFPYGLAFQTICTCVQVPELPSVALRARDMVWNALREGRSYVANRSVGTERGFMFQFVTQAGRNRQMGEDVPYTDRGRFRIRVPQEAEVVLRHNGQPLSWSTAVEMSFPAAGPGTYRVEVYLNRRLWILSNPIRLVDDDHVIQPTVSDVT